MYVMTDYGWEYNLGCGYTDGQTSVTSFTAGMYDDSVDDIQQTDDIEAITSEPTGAGYVRQSAATSGTALVFSAGRWRAELETTTFDVSDSTETVQSGFIAADFQADGDASPTTHLLVTGALGGVIDLSTRSGTFSIEGFGVVDATG